MSSRSYAKRNSKLEEQVDKDIAEGKVHRFDNVEDAIKSLEQDEPIIHVYLILNKDVKLTINGPVTGERYYFNGAGAKVSVDKRDADILIKKRRPNSKSCCGTEDSPYFTME